MSEQVELTIPDLGDFSDVEVIEVLVSPGDTVEVEQGILSLETDKATMDIPATHAGMVKIITVAVGDTVNQGDVYAVLEVSATTSAGADASAGENSTADAGADEVDEDDPEFAQTAVLPDAVRVQLTAASPSDQIEIRVPDIGDFADVEVIEVLVGVGDTVAAEDGLISIETDKATMDVPSPGGGVILEIKVSVGDKVNQGDLIAVLAGDQVAQSRAAERKGDTRKQKAIRVDAPQAPESPAPATVVASQIPEPPAQQKAPQKGLPPVDEVGFSRAHASPSVRKLARELGVNLAAVKGSGRKARILHDDVKAWVKQALSSPSGSAGGAGLPATPIVDFSRFGSVREVALSRIQKISGPRLQASWINLPHVTQHDEADITGLEQRRSVLKGPAKERGISLTPLAFVLRAVVKALKQFPNFAASLNENGDGLVMKDYCHLGFAADTPNGLMVPVIRNADRLDVYEMAEALAELSAAARDGKLKADQMQGAVFTVSSLGGIGGTAFTPIVNAPEVAILGVSRSSMKPVWNGESFDPRLILPLSLSYDHRVIDGAQAVRFTTHLGQLLGDVSGLLEATP